MIANGVGTGADKQVVTTGGEAAGAPVDVNGLLRARP